MASRRNLRPRKPFVVEEEAPKQPPKRAPRSSRSRVKEKDFIVSDKEESSEDDSYVSEVEEEVKPSRRLRSTRQKAQNTSRSTSNRRKTRRAAAPSFTADEEEEEKETVPAPSSSRRRRSKPVFVSRKTSDSDEEENESDAEEAEEAPSRRSRRKRGVFNFVPEDAAAKEDDSSSYSSQDDMDDGIDDDAPESDEDEFETRRTGASRKRKRSAAPSFRSASSTPSKKIRKPKIILPEDVPGREQRPEQPEEDPDGIEYNPLIAFVAVFVATFNSLFTDLPALPSPQVIEQDLMQEEPGPVVELIFRRLLVLVLNRKKELEIGRYSSALGELHALRGTLGVGQWFPPINWKSRSSAFKEMDWVGRLEFLNVLIHWSLSNSDRVRAVLKTLTEDLTMPWMGADEAGNHYYIVGFDPVGPDSLEFTKFRVYKESNRLLNNVSWRPIASNSQEVIEFMKSHLKPEEASDIKPEPKSEDEHEDAEEAKTDEAKTEDAKTEDAKTEDAEETKTEEAKTEETQGEETKTEEAQGEEVKSEATKTEEVKSEQTGEPANAEEQSNLPPSDPSKYDLPKTVVEILSNLLPSMLQSDEAEAARLVREAKKARRRNYLWTPPVPVEDRHIRRRRNRANFFDFVQQTTYMDEDDDRSSRRRRRRDETYEEPEPETRQQRHARLLADKQERMQQEQSQADTEESHAEQHAENQHAESQYESLKPAFTDTPNPIDAQHTPANTLAPNFPSANPLNDAMHPLPPTIPAASEPEVKETIAVVPNNFS